MRIHNENVDFFINSLAVSIDKNPASLENWGLLHIEHCEESQSSMREIILKQLKEIHTDVDCDAVQCFDNDIFIVTCGINNQQLEAIANEFINAASIDEGCVAKYAIYDLLVDWRAARDLLISKSNVVLNTTKKQNKDFCAENDSFIEIFSEVKKQRKSRTPLQVMLVEDDPITRRLVSAAFKEKYSLITAANAQEAVSNYLLYAPDIVFLDIGLPDASGFDVLHQIMTTDKDAYVVMFSANSYLDNITKALSSGASGFVAKPFHKEKMRNYIEDSAFHHHKQSA